MKKLWKIYFVVYAILVTAVLIGDILTSKPGSLSYIDAVCGFFSLWIVYAWAWRKPLIGRTNTVETTSIYLIALIVLDFINNFGKGQIASHSQVAGQVIFYIIFQVPAYIAIYLYIRNFDKLMKQKANK